MYNDYLIARRRIRIFGADSDLVMLGLKSFRPFEVPYDAAMPTSAVIETNCRPEIDMSRVTELTRFELEGWGGAECVFGRTGAEYVLRIVSDGEGELLFLYDIGTDRVRCNISREAPDMSAVRFGMWFMTALATVGHDVTPVHSSAIVCDGRAVLFLGESGTGKSTHTRLWRENISGAALLNDDSPFIGFVNGAATAFGAPWSGKTPCYKQEEYPIAAIVRLSQAPHNVIRRLRPLHAIGALLPSLTPAFGYDEDLQDKMVKTLSAVISQVPVYHLECLPDAGAAHLSYDTVFGKGE